MGLYIVRLQSKDQGCTFDVSLFIICAMSLSNVSSPDRQQSRRPILARLLGADHPIPHNIIDYIYCKNNMKVSNSEN